MEMAMAFWKVQAFLCVRVFIEPKRYTYTSNVCPSIDRVLQTGEIYHRKDQLIV